jgi:hypothetical protein
MSDEQPKFREVEQHLPGYTRTVKRYAKTCARCGKAFEGGPRAKYCSDQCMRAAWRERNPEKDAEQRRAAFARYQRKRYAAKKAERQQGAPPSDASDGGPQQGGEPGSGG